MSRSRWAPRGLAIASNVDVHIGVRLGIALALGLGVAAGASAGCGNDAPAPRTLPAPTHVDTPAPGGGEDRAPAGRPLPGFHESPAQVAWTMTRKLAFEAYAEWSMEPSHQGRCPTLAALASYLNPGSADRDPWGNAYVVACGGDLPAGSWGITVMSPGPDGRAGTDDDLRSWDEP